MNCLTYPITSQWSRMPTPTSNKKPRVCVKCGWVYPPSFNEVRCKFCGTQFKERICYLCGELKKPYAADNIICRECYNKKRVEDQRTRDANNAWRKRQIKQSEETYTEWQKLIAGKKFRPLIESEWIRACKYFNGCAICDTDEIAARGYFIPFEAGGRYAAWNIIPLCEKCATSLVVQPNPFRRLHRHLNDKGISKERLSKITDYLKRYMEE